MRLSINYLIFFAFFIIFLDLILIIKIKEHNYLVKHNKEKEEEMQDFLLNKFIKKRPYPKYWEKFDLDLFIRTYNRILQEMDMSEEIEKEVYEFVQRKGFHGLIQGFIKSRNQVKRKKAFIYLGYFKSDLNRRVLEDQLARTKHYNEKIYIVISLVAIRDKRSIKIIVDSLVGAPIEYQKKVAELLKDYEKDFFEYIRNLMGSKEIEIKYLISNFAGYYPDKKLRDYLFDLLDEENSYFLIESIFSSIKNLYVNELIIRNLIECDNRVVRMLTIKTLGSLNSIDNINLLINHFSGDSLDKEITRSLDRIANNNPEVSFYLINEFDRTNDSIIKKGISGIVANKMEYLIYKLITPEKAKYKRIITEVLNLGKTSEFIRFMNKNRNLDYDYELLEVLREVIRVNPRMEKELCTYLKKSILERINLTKCDYPFKPVDTKEEKEKIRWLYINLYMAMLVFPVIYFLRHHDLLMESLVYQMKIYVIDFNYYLIFYSFAINFIYLGILAISFFEAIKQKKLWYLKNIKFMFRKKILPTISILAPAYNEEATIIESINSLMNLEYPEYEIIVINDGSKDDTLQTMIDYFELERINYELDEKIKTVPIRGVFRNLKFKNLLVIDKENGGKADSLNAGINFAKGEYFCGIDADSLLERDALLKLASIDIDTDKVAYAFGGDVLPINGCDVDKGVLTKINIPKNLLARFQAVEYIRAFIGGRIGWAKINSLLIISGAFGLFKKDIIIEMGGYLTPSGKYNKYTVGEDMELVVRLTRYIYENNLPGKVMYAFNSNCWTEVPESLKQLLRQRDRWHRGLLDILNFHKDTLFKKKYKHMGLISMPYFFLFEMLGPLIEIQGYLMVVLAAIFGLLNTKIALLLLISIVLLGTLISIFSMLIAQEEMKYEEDNGFLVLLLYSILENFGFRQILSLWRMVGYKNAIKNENGWGKMERKGFANKA